MRRLRPEYILNVLRKSALNRVEEKKILNGQFGLERITLPLGDKPSGNAYWAWEVEWWLKRQHALASYAWNRESQLRCVKCHEVIFGIPKDILASNCCPSCKQSFYDAADYKWLDKTGYDLYRVRADGITKTLGMQFHGHIHGAEILVNVHGFMFVPDGMHIDHVYSIRRGFEDDLPLEIIASPPNLRVITMRANLSSSDFVK